MLNRQYDHQYATHSLQIALLARDYVILLIMAPANHFRNRDQLIRQIYIYDDLMTLSRTNRAGPKNINRYRMARGYL